MAVSKNPDGDPERILADPAVVVIFGASGDLTQRKLLPALFSLDCRGMLPEGVKVIGIARSDLSDQEFRDRIFAGVNKQNRLEPDLRALWPAFEERLFYIAGGYDDPETYQRLAKRALRLDKEGETGSNRLFYLAIPPEIYPEVVERLGGAGLNRSESGWSRIIVEKPFGHDLRSAHALNEKVHEHFQENQVYRIDHYLGKETVQNILSFRFANTIFEPLWNRNYVDHVQISVLESVGVGHRAGYYDTAGVVRDMFQNHLLQLLCLTAMEPPVAFNAKAMRDEKVKVLQAVRPISVFDGVWGQYNGYRQEPGVAQNSRTPTYLSLQLYVDNWRWQGIPFYLRSGKNLEGKSSVITLQFKDVPHLLFQDKAPLSPNLLSLCIQPDEGMHLQFETKVPGGGMRTDPVLMDFHYGDRFGEHALPDAYERLLLDALQGEASLFTRSDEIELAWSLVDPILSEWHGLSDPPLVMYDPGAPGPVEADDFLARYKRVWFEGCGEHET